MHQRTGEKNEVKQKDVLLALIDKLSAAQLKRVVAFARALQVESFSDREKAEAAEERRQKRGTK